MPKILAAVAAVLLLAAHASAKTYRIRATGEISSDSVPKTWGINMGFSHEQSNSHIWLRYLNPESARLFIQPLVASVAKNSSSSASYNTADWRGFTSNSGVSARQTHGSQFGRSFGGTEVDSMEAWLNAVSELRSVSAGSDGRDFIQWIATQTSIGWSRLLKALTTTGNSATIAQQGNGEYAIAAMRAMGLKIIAVWDVRCRHLKYTTTDPADPEYWKERYETYRLFYLGGRWLAKHKVEVIELYNEPDKDIACMDGPRWLDDARIRARALREAYADHSTMIGEEVVPELFAPTTSIPWSPEFSGILMEGMNVPFPENQPVDDGSYRMFDAFALHKYGSHSAPCSGFSSSCKFASGGGAWAAVQTAARHLEESNKPMPIHITELNCYTANNSDSRDHPYFNNVRVMELAPTAACLAGQLSSLITEGTTAASVSVFKFVQTMQSSGRIVKNGLFYAGVSSAPFPVTGSSKAGEAYRLLLRKTPPSRHADLWEVRSEPNLREKSRLHVHIVSDDQAYYVHSVNEDWNEHEINLKLADLAGVDPWAQVVASAVAGDSSSSFHGEVAFTQQLGPELRLVFTQPAGSVYVITVPKVPTTLVPTLPVDDATVIAGSNSVLGDQPALLVSTSGDSADGNAVTLLKFDAESATGGGYEKIVTAVLRLHVQAGGANTDAQVLTVLGLTEDFSEGSSTWSSINALRDVQGGVRSTMDNFINWKGDNPPSVVGHITVPPADVVNAAGGAFVALDVTDAVKSGVKVFALVRMFRFDETAAGPGDSPQGRYVFESKEASDSQLAPQLLIDVQVPGHPPPPESQPPPPPELVPVPEGEQVQGMAGANNGNHGDYDYDTKATPYYSPPLPPSPRAGVLSSSPSLQTVKPLNMKSPPGSKKFGILDITGKPVVVSPSPQPIPAGGLTAEKQQPEKVNTKLPKPAAPPATVPPSPAQQLAATDFLEPEVPLVKQKSPKPGKKSPKPIAPSPAPLPAATPQPLQQAASPSPTVTKSPKLPEKPPRPPKPTKKSPKPAKGSPKPTVAVPAPLPAAAPQPSQRESKSPNSLAVIGKSPENSLQPANSTNKKSPKPIGVSPAPLPAAAPKPIQQETAASPSPAATKSPKPTKKSPKPVKGSPKPTAAVPAPLPAAAPQPTQQAVSPSPVTKSSPKPAKKSPKPAKKKSPKPVAPAPLPAAVPQPSQAKVMTPSPLIAKPSKSPGKVISPSPSPSPKGNKKPNAGKVTVASLPEPILTDENFDFVLPQNLMTLQVKP